MFNRPFIALSTICTLAIVCLTAINSGQAHAAWYEAKGQAVIVNGNKEKARRDATEEALKQALLFAGASINSVQQLTNGLLKSEEVTISSTGEVNHLELTDEVWHRDYVTVSVRADIFPSTNQCRASAYEKSIATSYFLVENRSHLVDGKIPDLSESVTRELAREMFNQSDKMSITYIAPHSIKWKINDREEDIRALARQADSQFVLVGSIEDSSVERQQTSTLAFWKGEQATRYFAVNIYVYDGINGGLLLQQNYASHAPWYFDRFTDVDEFSSQFWRSPYGLAIHEQMYEIIADIEEVIACQPMTGRIVSVAGDHVITSLGRDNGLAPNDELYVYQTSEVTDRYGNTNLQYQVYPGVFVVEHAYGNTAKLIHKDSGIIANIQEGDFVVKK